MNVNQKKKNTTFSYIKEEKNNTLNVKMEDNGHDEL